MFSLLKLCQNNFSSSCYDKELRIMSTQSTKYAYNLNVFFSHTAKNVPGTVGNF